MAEGFERTGIQETLNFYNIARASCGECRSLLYVIEDNFPEFAEDAAHLRTKCIPIGIKLTHLIQSTKQRQAFTTLGTLSAIVLTLLLLKPLL
ncbi:MAG: four helix bundle protein [Verrucomicrobia bacterium]|nr:four helix bundle protein [Verrucomicrobiota bacterium]